MKNVEDGLAGQNISDLVLKEMLLNVAEVKKRGERKIDGFRKKFDDSRIWNFGMSRIRSQIKNGKHFCKLKNT